MTKEMRSVMKKIYYIALSLLLLTVDLVSKAWIQSNLTVGQTLVVIQDFFNITHVKNFGAAWSLFDGGAMRPFFLIVSLGVTGALVYYFIKEKHPLMLGAMALIFAGNLGNFYDRLTLGYVRDMLAFNIFGYRFPVFNVADMCLVIGFGILILYVYLEERGIIHE